MRRCAGTGRAGPGLSEDRTGSCRAFPGTGRESRARRTGRKLQSSGQGRIAATARWGPKAALSLDLLLSSNLSCLCRRRVRATRHESRRLRARRADGSASRVCDAFYRPDQRAPPRTQASQSLLAAACPRSYYSPASAPRPLSPSPLASNDPAPCHIGAEPLARA